MNNLTIQGDFGAIEALLGLNATEIHSFVESRTPMTIGDNLLYIGNMEVEVKCESSFSDVGDICVRPTRGQKELKLDLFLENKGRKEKAIESIAKVKQGLEEVETQLKELFSS